MTEKPLSAAIELNTVPIDSALGQRISVVGNGGKSTLSKALADKTGLPFIELDALFWKPNWEESSPEELIEKTNAAIASAPNGWIADGHYWSRLGDTVLGRADMVVWLDLPWRVMFWRTLLRSVRRVWDKNKICGDNTESWRKFFSTDSLWWYWLTHRQTFSQRRERLAALLPANTPVIRLKSAKELNQFYEMQGLTRTA